MKLTIDLDNYWAYDETIADCIKEAIMQEVSKEVRKVAKQAADDNREAIVALANAYAKRMVAEATKALQ